MIYLALGDSITYGYDATMENEKYVQKLTKKLNESKRTTLYVHAKPGWTSSQLMRSLERIPEVVIQEAEFITLLIGGNDLIKAMPWFLDNRETALERLRASFFPQVKEIIKKVKIHPQTTMYLCTVYNPFPNTELARFAVDGLNNMLREIADQDGCVLVPVDHHYGGQEQHLVNGYRSGVLEDFRLIRNPIHPNDQGHTRIAEAIHEAINRYDSTWQLQAKKERPRKKSSSSKRQRLLKRV